MDAPPRLSTWEIALLRRFRFVLCAPTMPEAGRPPCRDLHMSEICPNGERTEGSERKHRRWMREERMSARPRGVEPPALKPPMPSNVWPTTAVSITTAAGAAVATIQTPATAVDTTCGWVGNVCALRFLCLLAAGRAACCIRFTPRPPARGTLPDA